MSFGYSGRPTFEQCRGYLAESTGEAFAPNLPFYEGGPAQSFAIAPPLPLGLQLDPATGVISGIPETATAPGNHVVTATNPAGSATTTIEIQAVVSPPSSLTYLHNPVTYRVGTVIAPNSPSSVGGTVASYTVDPPLPQGLAIDAQTGVVSGTPTATAPRQSHTVTATGPGGNTTTPLSILVTSIPETPVVNGTVYAMANVGTTLYLGGAFTAVGGFRTGGGAVVDRETAQKSANDAWPAFNGGVNGAISDGAAGFYVGGSFTKIGGTSRSCLAHILGNGTPDPGWSSDAVCPNGTWAMALSGTTLFAAERYFIEGMSPRHNVAAFNAQTGQRLMWQAQARDGYVSAILVAQGKVFLAGDFKSIGGAAREGLAALDATTGELLTWPTSAFTGRAYTLAAEGDRIYAGGFFTAGGGTAARSNLAAFNAATGTLETWNARANGTVNAILPVGTVLYTGGEFTAAGGLARKGLAALTFTNGNATAWNPNRDVSPFRLAADDTRVYVVPMTGPPPAKEIFVFLRTTAAEVTWSPGPNGLVRALALSGSKAFLGGDFQTMGAVDRKGLAAIDTSSGQILPWNPGVNPPALSFATVYTLLASGNTIYVGGAFTGISTAAGRKALAALDGTSGAIVTTFAPVVAAPGTLIPTVRGLALIDGGLYVGGLFSAIGGVARRALARLNPTTGALHAWNPQLNGDLIAISASGNALYVNGTFTTIREQDRLGLAAIDASTASITAASGGLTPWNPAPVPLSSSLTAQLAILADPATFYVSGNATNLGGAPATLADSAGNLVVGLIGLEPSPAGGNATAWRPNVHASPCLVDDQYVYAGSANGPSVSRNTLTAFDKVTAAIAPWNPPAVGCTSALRIGNVTYFGAGMGGSALVAVDAAGNVF